MKLLIFIGFLLFPLNTAGKAQDVTIYVDDAYPPYSFQKNGRIQGLYNDILQAAFERMPDYNVMLQAVPWNRGKMLMETGEGMALSPPYFHGHDWPYLYPYSIPIYQETVVVVCNASVQQRVGPNWPEDYEGLMIGSIFGYDGWGGPQFREMVAEKKINYIEVRDAESLIKMVVTGRNDCILMEDFTFDVEYKRIIAQDQLDSKNQFNLFKKAIAGVDPVYVGYSATAIKNNTFPYQADFQRKLDIALYQLYKSGRMADIANTYRREENSLNTELQQEK